MPILYSLCLLLVAPILLSRLYAPKPNKPKIGKRWREHFGFTPALKHSRPIWIHAVSVGEVIAVKPLITQLLKIYPNQSILITTTTTTGAALVKTLDKRIEHRYMPIDFTFAIKRFLKSTQPHTLLIMETELWPNTLNAVHQANIPIVVINARLSKRAKERYQKVHRLFTSISQNINHISCQFKEDAHRFAELGVPTERLSISGSMKFDLPTFDCTQPSVLELTKMIHNRPTWIAASTHQGEDEILLSAHQTLLTTCPDALLILVPRHPERCQSVSELINKMGFTQIQRSQSAMINANTQVYLGDTLGEMMLLFSVADVTFMAGSLLGEKIGGHNLLEPASLAKPLLTGSSYYNFQIIGDELIQTGACQVCDTSEEIAKAVARLFSNADERKKQGQAALDVVNKNRGAVEKTLSQIKKFIAFESPVK